MVEGANVFQETLANNNQIIKMSQTQIEKLTEMYGKNNTSAEYLAKKQQELNKQLDAQNKKVQALTSIRDSYAKQDNASQSTLNKLNLEIGREEVAQLKLQNQLRETTTEIATQEAAAQAAAQAQEDARVAAEAEAKAQEEAQRATEQHTDAIVDQRSRLQHLGDGLRQAAKDAGLFGDKAIKAGEKIGRVGDKWSTRVSLPIAGGLTAAFAAFNTLDDGMDTVIRKTGATGQTLNALENAYNNLFNGIKTTAGDAGIAVGEVTTRFEATGQMLDGLAKDFIMFADVNETDLNGSIGKTSRILSQWGLGASSVKGFLGLVTNASHEAGIAVDTLMASVQENGATLKAMGFTLDQSVQFLARFEDAGINAEVALAALKKGAVTYAKDGKSLEDGFAGTVAAIQAAKTETEALAIAQKAFGVKGALEMATAIREDRMSVTGLSADMSQMTSVVSDAFNEINGDTPELDKLKNKAVAVGAAFSKNMLPWINEGADALTGMLTNFGKLDPEAQKTILTMAGITAATGPAIKGIGLLTQGVGFLSKGFSFLAGPYGWIALAAGSLLYLGVAMATAKTQAQQMDEQLKGIKITVDASSKAAITGAINEGINAANKVHEIQLQAKVDAATLQASVDAALADRDVTKKEFTAISKFVNEKVNPDIQAAKEALDKKVEEYKLSLEGAVDAQGKALTDEEKDVMLADFEAKNGQLIVDLQAEKENLIALLASLQSQRSPITDAQIAQLDEQLAKIANIREQLHIASDEVAAAGLANYALTVSGQGNEQSAGAAVGYVQQQQALAIAEAEKKKQTALASAGQDTAAAAKAWDDYNASVKSANETAQAAYQAIMDGVAQMAGADTTLKTIAQDYDALKAAMQFGETEYTTLNFSRLKDQWKSEVSSLFGEGGQLRNYLSEDDKIKIDDILSLGDHAGYYDMMAIQGIADSLIKQLGSALETNAKDPTLNPVNAVISSMLDSGSMNSIDPTKLDGAMEAVFKLYDAKARGSQIGGDIVAGVPVGIGEAAANLPADSFDKLKDAVLANLQTAFDSHSPARVVIPVGENVSAGVAVGIENNANVVQGAAELLPGRVSAGLSSLPGIGSSAGSGMMSALLQSLRNGRPLILHEASSIAAEIRRTLASAYAYRPSNKGLNVDMSLLTEEGFYQDNENAPLGSATKSAAASVGDAITIGPALSVGQVIVNKEADAYALLAAAEALRKRQQAGVGALKPRL